MLYNTKHGELANHNTAMHTHRPGYESVRVTSDSPSNTLMQNGDTLTRTEDELAQQKLVNVISNIGYTEARRESTN